MAAIERFSKAVVVGASSGIGEAIAVQLAAAGTEVALVARRAAELDAVAARIRAAGGTARVYAHDVTAFDAAAALFDRIRAEAGGLDLLVYAAAVMPKIAEHEYDNTKDRLMIDVNLTGAVVWCNLAAPHFESQGRGTIVGIGSIAGARGRRANPVYGTTKAALSTYLEALRNRCSRYGVNVVTAEPGFVDTAMTKGMKGLLWLISADEAATRILALAKRGDSAASYVPRRWWIVATIIRLIPSFLFRRMSI